jgi:hypothetical protein
MLTATPTTRVCCRCHVEKPLNDFGRRSTRPLGRKYICKSCEAICQRERYVRDPQHARDRMNARRAHDPQHVRDLDNASVARTSARNDGREPNRSGRKTCWACHKTLPRTEFGRNRDRLDGLQSRCMTCATTRCAEYNATHREEQREYDANRRNSIDCVAAKFRCAYGYTIAASFIIATRCLDPYERDAVTGQPCWQLQHDRCKRLTPDAIRPGVHTLEGTRLLTLRVNTRRNANLRTDHELLRHETRRLERYHAPADLYWLHSTPGAGGRRFRNVRAQAKHEALTGRILAMTGPLEPGHALAAAWTALTASRPWKCMTFAEREATRQEFATAADWLWSKYDEEQQDDRAKRPDIEPWNTPVTTQHNAVAEATASGGISHE